MTTKVSVIIPVYNVAPYLKQCLDSCINQTLSDIEFICINDGSTDNSMEILNEYASKDSRIKVLSQENQGQGVARNRGIEISTGEYMAFVDPDDWVELDAYETLYNFAKEKNAKVVHFDTREYNEYSGKIKDLSFKETLKKEFKYDLDKAPAYSWRDFKKGYLTKLELHVWSHFYKTDFIKRNKLHFTATKIGEDHLFADGAILLTDKIYYLNRCLYNYRIRSGSSDNSRSENSFSVFENIQAMKDFLKEHSLYAECEEEFHEYARTAIGWHYFLVPEDRISEYETKAQKYFGSEKELKKYLKKITTDRNFFEQIFSIKNKKENGIKRKIITILGIQIKLQPKKK